MWGEFVSLFYPRVCISCSNVLNSVENHICLTCTIQLPKTYYHNDPQNPLYKKLCNTANIKHAFAYLKYQRKGVSQKLLRELKYKGNQELGLMLGNLYGQELAISGFGMSFDIVAPIPLHANKLKRRGYNQSDLLAKAIAGPLNASFVPDLIYRTVDTATQTKKHKAERWANTNEIFGLNLDFDLTDKRVLVIDDVITTGATVESAIEVVMMGNPENVSVCGLATGQ